MAAIAERRYTKGSAGRSREERRPLLLASEGRGPLLQRDFIVVVRGSECSPEEAVRKIRTESPALSPPHLAAFQRTDGGAGPLRVGDTLHVLLRGYGHCGVVAVDTRPRSLTLRTLKGHLEAGRVSFGAAYTGGGLLLCRIRSRSRFASALHYLAYQTVGNHLQTRIWVGFLKRLGAACGGEVVGDVVTSTDQVDEDPADRGETDTPTFDEACAG